MQRLRDRGRGAALALAAMLAGCAPVAALFAPPPPAKPTVIRPQARPSPARPSSARPAPARPGPALPAQADPAMPPSAAAPVPAQPPLDLAGLSAARVEALLGVPADRATTGTGERWTYRGEGCAVELFLFPDVTTGELGVLDRRVQGGEGEQDCLRRVRDAAAR